MTKTTTTYQATPVTNEVPNPLFQTITADAAGSMWGFSFRAEPVRNFADAKGSDVERFKRFFHAALERGVYLAPSAFEAAFMSDAHDDAIIEETLNRLDDAMRHAG